jgi:ClpP class serine protease
VFTFAEDYVFGSALVLLTSGNKSYVSKYTVIGDIGYTHSSFGLKQFAEHWDYERKYIYSGQNKVRLNQYEDLK